MFLYSLSEIFFSLYRQKMRVFFSALALCIATTSLICLWCFYHQASLQMYATMDKIQSHAVVHISQFDWQSESIFKFTFSNIQRRLGHLLNGYTWSVSSSQSEKIMLNKRNVHVNHLLASTDFIKTLGLELHYGRYFTVDDTFDSYYCIIGHGLYKKLLQHGIHQDTIAINSKRYRIIGVLKDDKNSKLHIDVNNSLISLLSPSQQLNHDMQFLSVHIPSHALSGQIPEHIAHSVISAFEDYNFYVFDPIASIQQLQYQITNLQYLVGGIALSCFAVVSSSVINSLLASIVERRKEIGIRIALGASRANIRSMLLGEMSLLSVISSLIGIVVAMLLLKLYSYQVGESYSVELGVYVISFFITYIMAVIATLYPTYKAQNFGPIQLMQDRL